MTEPMPVQPPPGTRPASRLARLLGHPVFLSLLLAAAALAVYYPAVHCGFVSFDDPDYVTANPHVKAGLKGATVAWAFRTGHAGNWHPLTWLSHALDVQLYGLNPPGHHLTNLLFHAANSVLLFLLLRRMTSTGPRAVPGSQSLPVLPHCEPGTACDPAAVGMRKEECGKKEGDAAEPPGISPNPQPSTLNPQPCTTAWPSFFVAALFALHPLHVESVAWVAERKDVLSGFFFMLTLWAYGRYAEGLSLASRVSSLESTVHSPQSTVHSPQSTVRSPQSAEDAPRSTLHPSRFTFHVSRITYHVSRITLHASRFYVLALLFFALGLMSKPMLVTVPFVLLLLDYWPLGRFGSLESRVQSLKSTVPGPQSTGVSGHSHPVAAGILPAVEGGILPPGGAPGACGTAFPPGKMPGSTAGKMPTATAQDGVGFQKCPQPSDQTARKSQIVYRILLEKLPFLLLSLVSCLVTVLAQKRAIQPLANLSLGVRFGNALFSYVRYLGKTFWPFDLATPYPHPGHWPIASVLLAAALLAGLTLAALWLGRRYPYLFTGWFWFLGMLVPVIGLVQVGEQSMADRYTYLPLIGIFIIVVWGFSSLKAQVSSLKSQGGRAAATAMRSNALPAPHAPYVLTALALAVLAACALRTRDQLRVWHGSESLYRHAVAVSSRNFIAYQNLGAWLDNEGRTDEALTNYFKALEIQPHYPDPLNNIGCILAGRNQFAEAIPYFEAALRSQPEFVDANANLAAALFKLRRFKEAIPHLRVVVKEKPEDTGALNRLGNALASQGQYAEAVQYYEASLRVKPDQVAAHYDLANALANLRRPGEAIAQYRLALQAKPDLAEAHHDLGMLLARQGKVEEAIAQLREAVHCEPRSAVFQLSLGLVLAARQDFSAAITSYNQALQIAPNNPDAHNALGAALAVTGKLDEAIVQFREVLRLRPDNASAQCNLGKALAAQGKSEEAIAHLTEALRLKPDFAQARQALQALTGHEPQTAPPQDSRFSP
jgi:Flp pilus assembly protein TadD